MHQTIEIPKGRWKTFVQLISQRLWKRPVRIELQRRDPAGRRRPAQLLPLLGVKLETKGPEREDLLISVESWRGSALQHRVGCPLHLYLTHDEAGEMQCLAIEAVGGARTVLHFRHWPAAHAGQTEQTATTQQAATA